MLILSDAQCAAIVEILERYQRALQEMLDKQKTDREVQDAYNAR
jgi:ferric-dicitrate binding protein FerR (iron transport regulator)